MSSSGSNQLPKGRHSLRSSSSKPVTPSGSEQGRASTPKSESLSHTIREDAIAISREEQSEISSWVELFPTTKSKKNLNRDFSDGVLMAELIHYFFPKFVDLHNYAGASSAKAKKVNWVTLNKKVFTKLGINLCDAIIENVVQAKAGAIEKVLLEVKKRIESIHAEREAAVARAAMIGQGGDGEGCLDEDLIDVTCQAPAGNPPKFVKHAGYKYVLETMLDDKLKALSDTNARIKELEVKNRRMETLVSLKEQRLEDLTLQLHRMKIEYENKTSPDGSSSKPRLPWNGYI